MVWKSKNINNFQNPWVVKGFTRLDKVKSLVLGQLCSFLTAQEKTFKVYMILKKKHFVYLLLFSPWYNYISNLSL